MFLKKQFLETTQLLFTPAVNVMMMLRMKSGKWRTLFLEHFLLVIAG
jgi:hypothetical protein